MKCDNCGHEWDTMVSRMKCPDCGNIVERRINYKSPVKKEDEDEDNE